MLAGADRTRRFPERREENARELVIQFTLRVFPKFTPVVVARCSRRPATAGVVGEF